MHAFSFAVKRAHLCTLAVLKKMVKGVGLTPARFDVMFVLWKMGGACDQSTLWKRLGVTRQTIAKMVEGMEEKGLVWRREDEHDRRQLGVYMTKYGLERFVAAAHELFRTEKLRSRFDRMHRDGRAFVEKALEVVKHAGRALQDTAHHYYSIHAPDALSVEMADELDVVVAKYVERLEKHRPKKLEPEPDVDDLEPDPYDLTEAEQELFRKNLTPIELQRGLEAIWGPMGE